MSLDPNSASVAALALDRLERRDPTRLIDGIAKYAGAEGVDLSASFEVDFANHLASASPNDPVVRAISHAVNNWEHVEESWTNGTAPHSEDRRALLFSILGVADSTRKAIEDCCPRFRGDEIAVIISDRHTSWLPEWKRRAPAAAYWSAYVRQLSPPAGTWTDSAIQRLEHSVEDVLARLSRPTATEIYPVKGLVVGYVQSGKTSHFAGLIAKAADAGYRLCIVLAGTLDILRRQTQRRLDKMVVGRSPLLEQEYGADAEWNDFVVHDLGHGASPNFEWQRLTTRDADYSRNQFAQALEYPKSNRSKPLNHPDNLWTAPARLAVIKKNPSRINALCKDLEQLSQLRRLLEEVPTLIIDDESDQASINTIDPSRRRPDRERTETNKAIGRLLRALPRAQYVGYTATPFANVFIDPNDAEDLFPKDFIISLPKPSGYMGAREFHDFDEDVPEVGYQGNERALVRTVAGENEDPDNLPKAIDSFVLSGAIKLFRAQANEGTFRPTHHTMLVHLSANRSEQEQVRQQVEAIFLGGARYNRSTVLSALRSLFESDFLPVMQARATDDLIPESFDVLKPFISACITRICAGKPVRIVNGEEQHRDDTPDFDVQSVWAILIGGNKLSRGYTVEGLTVSYYRRKAAAGDTLMQMGRWFGFRRGYADLVRLFIGRREPGKGGVVDLYASFEAVCRDEEALRGDLQKYSGELKPRQVPPLVTQHAVDMPVTARNKMFNAILTRRDLSGEWEEKLLAPIDAGDVRSNLSLLRTLLTGGEGGRVGDIAFVNAGGQARSFKARFWGASCESVNRFLSEYRWSVVPKSFDLLKRFAAEKAADGTFPGWCVMLPQTVRGEAAPYELETVGALTTVARSRTSDGRFKAYSEPRHREAAAAIAGVAKITDPADGLREELREARPVLVVYLVRAADSGTGVPSVGFGVQFSGSRGASGRLEWTVLDRENESAIVIKANG